MKRVLLVFGITFSILTAYADENVLQTIEIEPAKDSYNIVLVSDKAVDVKKTVQASNKITLTMKDIRASKTLNTVYNNVSNVDSVMVEPQGNGISIFFQADNASAASVTFDALTTAIIPAKKPAQSIKLNNPIESYAPIYHEDFEPVKTSKMFDRIKASSTVANIKDSLSETVSPDSANKITTIGLISLLAFSVIRLFRRREPEMKIGLSQSLNEREINMYKGIQPLQQTYTTSEKPFSTVNYGMNAYQKQERNPYDMETSHIHNPRLRNYNSSLGADIATQTVNRPIQQQTKTVTQPQVKKMTTPVNTAPVNQSNPNIDNLKFLESMTAIYEKSGRHDLARGLKASLNKNNIKQ
ncbi:MAG: hypothetical protein E7Z89_04045 [Cyanobacteria bacterium SIG28]|nr:hypothetical protein [Cyanobacteria bacterium SIG28]